MSLKAFHIVLISLSSLLTLVFGGWSVHGFRATGEWSHLALAVSFFAIAVGLAIYIVWFARRVRTRDQDDRRRRKIIRPLATALGVWLLTPRAADACSVCYGQGDGPMIDAARLGVWLLFGLVLAVQLSFVLFFLYLRRRARAYQACSEEWIQR